MPVEAEALLLATSADDLAHVLAQQRDGRKTLRAEAKATRGRGRGRGRGHAPAKNQQAAEPRQNVPDAAGPGQDALEAAEPRQDSQPKEAVSKAKAKRACEKRAEPQQDGQPEAVSKAKAKRVCEKPGDTEERPSKSAKKPPLDQVWPILHAAF